MTGYKLLTIEGRSLSADYGSVQYALDGTPTPVPGRGAFVGLTLPGLLRGGLGPLLAEMEYGDVRGGDDEVIEAGTVRVLRLAPVDAWTLVRVAIRAAELVLPLTGELRPLAEDCLATARRCEQIVVSAPHGATWMTPTRAAAEAAAAETWDTWHRMESGEAEAALAAARWAAAAVEAASWPTRDGRRRLAVHEAIRESMKWAAASAAAAAEAEEWNGWEAAETGAHVAILDYLCEEVFGTGGRPLGRRGLGHPRGWV